MEGSLQVIFSEFEGKPILKVAPEGLELLAKTAMRDCSFLLRTEHHKMVAKVLADPEARRDYVFAAKDRLDEMPFHERAVRDGRCRSR